MLHPREVVFPLMFASDGKSNDGRTVGSFFAEELLKETRETTYAALQIKTRRLEHGRASSSPARQTEKRPRASHRRTNYSGILGLLTGFWRVYLISRRDCLAIELRALPVLGAEPEKYGLQAADGLA